MMNDDPLQLLPTDPKFNQRYIAVYFYFATSVEHEWDTCGIPASNSTADEACMFQVLGTYDLYYIPAVRWLSTQDVCDWAGIACGEDSEVRAVNMRGNNVTGSFPEGIKYFNFLAELSLGYGKLSGPL